MSAIILLDTSVYLNVLDIPGRNQQKTEILNKFAEYIKANAQFLLPMATIWETGSHISRLGDGRTRRKYAVKLVENVQRAINGDIPYSPTCFPDRDKFIQWMADFPETAQRNKSPEKTNEGESLADHSIIKEWEQVRQTNPHKQVIIWSLDTDLSGYDTGVL